MTDKIPKSGKCLICDKKAFTSKGAIYSQLGVQSGLICVKCIRERLGGKTLLIRDCPNIIADNAEVKAKELGFTFRGYAIRLLEIGGKS